MNMTQYKNTRRSRLRLSKAWSFFNVGFFIKNLSHLIVYQMAFNYCYAIKRRKAYVTTNTTKPHKPKTKKLDEQDLGLIATN